MSIERVRSMSARNLTPWHEIDCVADLDHPDHYRALFEEARIAYHELELTSLLLNEKDITEHWQPASITSVVLSVHQLTDKVSERAFERENFFGRVLLFKSVPNSIKLYLPRAA